MQVAIDELHVVVEWGTSWKLAYSKLSVRFNIIIIIKHLTRYSNLNFNILKF